MTQFTVTDRWELLALHKTIMEAKFHDDPHNTYVGPSPLVADMADRVVEALIEAELAAGKSSAREEWARWRDAAQHEHFVDAVRGMIRRSTVWKKLDATEQRRFVVDGFRPLVAPPELVDELVAGGAEPEDGA